MSNRQYLVVSATIFVLVAFVHLMRVISGMPVQAGEYAVPMYASWFGIVVPAALAIWAMRLLSKNPGA